MKAVNKGTGIPKEKAIAARGIRSLTAAQVKEHFARLRELLRIADTAFTDSTQPKFPSELLEIPELIAELQNAIGKKTSYRVPFWKCVVALDHARTGLALIVTLNDLVKRACALPPGPLVTLLTLQNQGLLTQSESTLVNLLARKSDKDLDDPPSNLTQLTPVLERVASRHYLKMASSLRSKAPHIMPYAEVKEFMAFCLYLDFASEHRKWLDRYLPSLEPFSLLLSELENEDYDKQRHRILFGYLRAELTMKEGHAKAMSAARQRKYQKTHGRSGNSASRTGKPGRTRKKRTLKSLRKR